jgi:dihydrofolate synthase / folylpolyglutamate synthase
METFTKHDYLDSIKILTSQGKFYINLGLDRIKSILSLLGNPQDKLKVIHVAGTNGKGSTCAMLASVLSEAGYKTGLYTSPHLIEYTERVKIDGEDISREHFAELVLGIIELAESNNIHLTEFEILTALAFVYFNEQKVDFVVLETGLGGRLDATNVVNPLLSIITTIDFDHIDRLGDTIEKIAFEKAGIIKENIPVITLKDNNGFEIIQKIAVKNKSPLITSDYSANDKFELPLLGLWQSKNLSLVLKAVETLNKKFPIPEQQVKSGLKKVQWPGRLQYIEDKNMILDGAHNLSGAKLLREIIDYYFPDKKLIWIYSSLSTKDYRSIVRALFRENEVVICTRSKSLSAVSPNDLKNEITSLDINLKVLAVDDLKEALTLSSKYMKNVYINNKNLIVIAGSLYSIGEVLDILRNSDPG